MVVFQLSLIALTSAAGAVIAALQGRKIGEVLARRYGASLDRAEEDYTPQPEDDQAQAVEELKRALDQIGHDTREPLPRAKVS